MATGTHKRYGAQSERGKIEAWCGIVSARLGDIAGAFSATPEDVLEAVEEEGITPVLDTAEPKREGKDWVRPTAPQLRSLAFTLGDFKAVAKRAGTEDVPA